MRQVLLIIATLASCFALPAKLSNLKIYGGKTAEPGQFPFAVAINSTSYGVEWCAGSIIHENWILTSATCSASLDDWEKQQIVISGTNRLDSDSGVVYNISKIVLHPNFTIGSFPKADIALYQIDGSFTFSDLVQSIEIGEVSVDDTVVVAGWGTTETRLNNPPLQYTELTVWSNEDCTKALGQRALEPEEVCALGGEGVGLCTGDFGAPLILNGTLVGLSSWESWVIGGCGGGKPDVFTRVNAYKDWIDSVIKS